MQIKNASLFIVALLLYEGILFAHWLSAVFALASVNRIIFIETFQFTNGDRSGRFTRGMVVIWR